MVETKAARHWEATVEIRMDSKVAAEADEGRAADRDGAGMGLSGKLDTGAVVVHNADGGVGASVLDRAALGPKPGHRLFPAVLAELSQLVNEIVVVEPGGRKNPQNTLGYSP